MGKSFRKQLNPEGDSESYSPERVSREKGAAFPADRAAGPSGRFHVLRSLVNPMSWLDVI